MWIEGRNEGHEVAGSVHTIISNIVYAILKAEEWQSSHMLL